MKIAINGFGRIGRTVFKVALERGVNVAVINDSHGAKDAAYLLKYDSVYGRYGKKVEVRGKDLVVAGKRIKIIGERDPERILWKKLGVDVVVESTGAFRDRVGASKHFKGGARYVIMTAPAKGDKEADITLVPGVNDKKLSKNHKIISVGSCTTNALAPLVKVLNDKFGIEQGFMTTVHGYTSSQNLVDGSARKVARGRAAALNIVPTTTGASDAVVRALPELKGKLGGMAMRVPVASGSIVDLTVKLKKKANAHVINKAFKDASRKGMKGILSCTKEPLVSSDIIGEVYSAILLEGETKANGNLVKVMAWYDNEWGYSCRVVDVIRMLR